ncbi:unnamed protein product [Rotaria magnacalcarata]|uniref:Uncharacterized protein n=4 Tax=Rotaria magnacalcarata TaxID=392030 RepID=A0A816AFT3_9BILA|nr:unnamed protein product [Rotaria magnacalcarata]CAF1596296.1 unnamed protein product [Rotaria magnacalcarata]CAF2110529.1 unnamed protein product [Rotaria magnacalcarata]CAF3900700.1 unnamed protein product [Rotaria magnacalcarata]
MVTRCLFGLFVFGSNSSVIYRFLTDDLCDYLRQCFKTRGYKLNDDVKDEINNNNNNNNNDDELTLSIDDAISQHLSVLIRVLEQTSARYDPIRRITLQSGVQVFFDQIADNNLICMADKSFDTIVILKAINLLKALIKFHIGVLPFIHYNVADQLINRISASLQYFLNNVTMNQSILFESCEYLHMNSIIREQCRDVCTMISNDVQNWLKVPRKIIIITCDDKIVHMHLSADQSRPNNADIFLLVLNNTSRSLRREFESQKNLSNVMNHRFKRKISTHHPHSSFPTTAADSMSNGSDIDRAQSCPNFQLSQLTSSNDKYERIHRSEVVFLRTANKVIAPFTLFTIPLTDHISVLVLVEWENSTVCSNLYALIRHLDSYTTHGFFPYNKLTPQVKTVESSAAVRRYFEHAGHPSTILIDILNKAYALHKSSTKTNVTNDERHRNGLRILRYLTEMSRLSTDAFRDLFFDSDEYARRSGIDTANKDFESDVQMDGIGPTDTKFRKNEYDTSPMTKILRKKITSRLEDWFSFIEVKSQRNITMNFCRNEFPGLVHFVFVDRSRGLICTPALIIDDYHTLINRHSEDLEYFLEKKILAFELECLSALQHGFTSYTMSDEHFTYNYTLRLQESNGASMRLYKAFVQSQPPGVVHFDFYKALVDEYYPWLVYQSSVICFELITVHLRVVPPRVVREQCELLWPRLLEPEE